MRSHEALLSSRPPSTACSASTECGGRRSDSIWASPGTPERANRSEPAGTEGIVGFISSLNGRGGRCSHIARGECVTRFLCTQLDKPVDKLWASGFFHGKACGGK